MNVFIFLFSGVDFLFLLLLSSVEVRSKIEIGVVLNGLQRAQVASLIDYSAVLSIIVEEN